MNKFVKALKDIDLDKVKEIIKTEPQWLAWAEVDSKNGLHYLCGVPISQYPGKSDDSLRILKLLLKSGMDINSIHKKADKNCDFPATPLWYAYTRGRNEKVYRYLLRQGADPEHCMYAIAWYDDAEAAALFKKHGAVIEGSSDMDSPFLAAIGWRKFNVAKWFLENGANVDFADHNGNTALFYSVKRKYDAAIIRLLVKHGADPDRPNNDGISPRKLASSYRDKTVSNLFS
jgi:ankyrin repeat protein